MGSYSDTQSLKEEVLMEVTRTQVRIPADLMDWLKQQAKEQNRSMNAQLVEMLAQLKRKAA